MQDGTDLPRRFANLVIDVSGHQVSLDSRDINLTRLEFALLVALTQRPGVVMKPEKLLEEVWGYAWLGDDHVVETHIGRLRNKLGESGRAPRFIHTVRGVGYRFVEPGNRPPMITGVAVDDREGSGALHMHHVVYDAGMMVTAVEPINVPVLGWAADALVGRFHIFADDPLLRENPVAAIGVATVLAHSPSRSQPSVLSVRDSVGNRHVISSLMCFATPIEGAFAGMTAHLLIDGGWFAAQSSWPKGAHGSLCISEEWR
jgi:DNA-binding winged helix-turn-helix (wHTH) protein